MSIGLLALCTIKERRLATAAQETILPHICCSCLFCNAVVLGRYKLHVARYNSQVYSPPPASGRVNLPLPAPELYDLLTDPDESYDIAPAHPEIVTDIQARMERMMRTFPEDIRTAWAKTKSLRIADSPAGALPHAIQP